MSAESKPRPLRVTVEGTSLVYYAESIAEARRSAQMFSKRHATVARIVQLLPDYRVLDTYENGVEKTPAAI